MARRIKTGPTVYWERKDVVDYSRKLLDHAMAGFPHEKRSQRRWLQKEFILNEEVEKLGKAHTALLRHIRTDCLTFDQITDACSKVPSELQAYLRPLVEGQDDAERIILHIFRENGNKPMSRAQILIPYNRMHTRTDDEGLKTILVRMRDKSLIASKRS